VAQGPWQLSCSLLTGGGGPAAQSHATVTALENACEKVSAASGRLRLLRACFAAH
jgi:hypothetical protein